MYADQTITNHQPTSFLSPLKCTYQIKIDWLLDLLIASKSSLTGFAFLCYRIGLKNLQHQNWKQNQLKLETCSYRFPMLCVIIISPQCTMGCTRSHTMCQRYAITLSFDWFTALFECVRDQHECPGYMLYFGDRAHFILAICDPIWEKGA